MRRVSESDDRGSAVGRKQALKQCLSGLRVFDQRAVAGHDGSAEVELPMEAKHILMPPARRQRYPYAAVAELLNRGGIRSADQFVRPEERIVQIDGGKAERKRGRRCHGSFVSPFAKRMLGRCRAPLRADPMNSEKST
jgi:hypothetical protein